MEEVDLLIEHGYIITMDDLGTQIRSGSIAVRRGIILAIGPDDRLHGRYNPSRRIDASGKYVFPGLINTHAHMFQVYVKGLGKDKSLVGWLEEHVRPLVPRLNEELCYLAAMAGCVEAMHSGVTTVLDYMYAQTSPGLSDAVIRAFSDTGFRGILARGFSDRAYGDEAQRRLVEPIDKVLLDVERLARDHAGNPLLRVWLAPTAIWNLTDEGLRLTAEFARSHGMPVTMHLCETPRDDETTLARFGRRAVPFLADLGFLDAHFLAVHAVHLRDEDVDLLRRFDVGVSHNPASNMLLGSGIAPIAKLWRHGVRVGLATDGAGSNDGQDMIEAMKLTALLQKVAAEDPSVLASVDVLRMATKCGADVLGIGDVTGSLEVGKAADLFVYDPLKPKSAPVLDPVSSLVLSSTEGNIDTTVIAGRVVMEGGVVNGIDEETLLRELTSAAETLTR